MGAFLLCGHRLFRASGGGHQAQRKGPDPGAPGEGDWRASRISRASAGRSRYKPFDPKDPSCRQGQNADLPRQVPGRRKGGKADRLDDHRLTLSRACREKTPAGSTDPQALALNLRSQRAFMPFFEVEDLSISFGGLRRAERHLLLRWKRGRFLPSSDPTARERPPCSTASTASTGRNKAGSGSRTTRPRREASGSDRQAGHRQDLPEHRAVFQHEHHGKHHAGTPHPHENRAVPGHLHVGEAFFCGHGGDGNTARKVEEIIDFLDLQVGEKCHRGGASLRHPEGGGAGPGPGHWNRSCCFWTSRAPA